MSDGAYTVLAIGGSAGSLPVVCGMLEGLAADTTLAVVVCMHTGARDAGDMCDVLARHSALPVIEAECDTPVRAATVHVACGGYHLLVERDARFALCAGARVQYARPSIDVLFESMAEAFRARLAGMLLSGANADGAAGLARIQALGGLTMIQRPETARAPEMPEAALARFTPDRQYGPEQLKAATFELAQLARPAA